MGKVVICGIDASGKTCYFYGMLHRMLLGYHGFAISPQSENNDGVYGRIWAELKRLGDMKLPLKERFPVPTNKTEKYKLNLYYNYKTMEEIEWIDYPGEFVSTGKHEFLEYFKDADCLIVCIDGERIKGDADDLDSIVYEFQHDCGGMDLNIMLSEAAEESDDQLPPVCVLITKYDAISPELRSKESIEYIVKNVFSVLFHEDGEEGINRIATICTVSLGEDVQNGGKLDPIRMEGPICFAAYCIMAKKLASMKAMTRDDEIIDSIHIFPGPRPSKDLKAMQQNLLWLIEQCEEIMKNLELVIGMMPLYVNGELKEWNEIFKSYEKAL